ncbi:MAG: hypothetical protein NC087_06475 [Anaeroplasma bactoclasticum]|nr:hypothetical protein [Anaeroplasma bactoclasticum]
MCNNLLYKTSDKKYKEKYNRFLLLCEKYKAKIIKFDYYKKVFGNFVIEIEYNMKLHTIITDRGDIFINDSFVSHNSYQIDTFSKLLEMVEKGLFSE